ncbi:hypothetical protein D5E86_25755 [Vibrio parahaemolyticus]|nr:hypothetical protein D5E86_25755 [Vibrio parahaemolyticus]
MTSLLKGILAKTVFKTKLPSHFRLCISQVVFIAIFVTLADLCSYYIISNEMTLSSPVPDWTDYLLKPFEAKKVYVLMALAALMSLLNVLYDRFQHQQTRIATICINKILGSFSLFTGLLVFSRIVTTNDLFLETTPDLNIYTVMFIFTSHMLLKMASDIFKL